MPIAPEVSRDERTSSRLLELTCHLLESKIADLL